MTCVLLAACPAATPGQAATSGGDQRTVRPAGVHGGPLGDERLSDERRLSRYAGAFSHGCIRVPNGAISRLWPLLPIGTPVVIL